MDQSRKDFKKLVSEVKKELRREIDEDRIAWLDKEWQGPNWLPADVVRPHKPCRSVVRCLKNITELAIMGEIALSSLWEPGGFIRSVHKHPNFTRLTKKMVMQAHKNMVSSMCGAGNDSSSSLGSAIEDDFSQKETINSQLSSPSFGSSTEQQVPSPHYETAASTEDDNRVSPRTAKQALEDDADEPWDSPRNKSPRLTINEVLGNLSSDRIETARLLMGIELDTAFSVKRDAKRALMDLLRHDCSVAGNQAEIVQARNRKQQADEAILQTHERLHGPSQTLAAMSNLKRTFDARAVRVLEFENAEEVTQACKDRLDRAQVNHEAALKSNPIDYWYLEAVWGMLMRAEAHDEDIQ
ncbi:hypothetical protein NOF04DRAFT_1349316 [Fusarium oxysporum II5]|nr:hypothetical protein NOF04DRAFT_1349316 [Fusarium oxysporum II5]